jgi:beta-glucosidase
MSLEEKIRFCSGADFSHTRSFEQYGIPAIRMVDGPHGVRISADEFSYPGSAATIRSTCFPPACTTACSWDRDLLQKIGVALGEEARQSGISILLGPGINIKRNPLCGRNFEYFSEDPFLAGEMGIAWVKGIQSQGVGVSLKHFAANNQETQRTSVDSLIDLRTLREIYLSAFEMVVREANPATVMCAYNKVNGIYCSDHAFLLRQVLRDEWGFAGVVISDWGAVNDRVAGFKAGLDLEMPGSGGFFDQEVLEAVQKGSISVEYINESVDRLLSLVINSVQTQKENALYDVEMHDHLAQKIAAESAVLLKNENGILPLDRKVRIALIGALASEPRIQGAGSSWVNPTSLSNAIDGFTAHELDFTYHPGYLLKNGNNDVLAKAAIDAARECEIVVFFAGLPAVYESEGYDRTDMKLPTQQNELIERVARVNPNVVVVLSGGAPVEMPWLSKVKAVLNMYLPGQAGGQAAAELLTGLVNPSGKLAESYPLVYDDVPSAGLYETGGRQAQYCEGIYIGYRYYDKAQKSVCFPFGHGLSYTAFEYSNLEISSDNVREGEVLTVSMTVRNSGHKDGAEVVQLYVGDLAQNTFRAEKELKGFEKVFLRVGEQQKVKLQLDCRSFSCYDPSTQTWIIPEGNYRISVGSSSRDIRLSQQVVVHGKKNPAVQVSGSTWYYTLQGKPTQSDLESLLGHTIEPMHSPQKGEYTIFSSLQDMQTNPIIRIMKKVVEGTVAKGYGGADYFNPNFKGIIETTANNPLRSLVTSSNGALRLNVAQGLVDLANGHLIKGLKSFFSGVPKPDQTKIYYQE